MWTKKNYGHDSKRLNVTLVLFVVKICPNKNLNLIFFCDINLKFVTTYGFDFLAVLGLNMFLKICISYEI